MNKAEAIIQMHKATPQEFRVEDSGTGQKISYWNVVRDGVLVAQPTDADLQPHWLDVVKKLKIKELRGRCGREIEAGFKSTTVPYSFDFASHDQLNFNQQTDILNNDTTITTVAWRTADSQTLSLSRDEFKAVFKESFDHKNSNRNHYWKLKDKVNACTTETDVNNITWETVV